MEKDDFEKIFNNIIKKHNNIMNSLKVKHKKNLDYMLNEQRGVKYGCQFDISSFEYKTVFNFSDHRLSKVEAGVLGKGFKFALTNSKIPGLDIIASIEEGIHPLNDDDKSELRCRINMLLNKPLNIKRNLTSNEYKALQDLKMNRELTIRRADKRGGF